MERLEKFWEPPASLRSWDVSVYGPDLFCQVLAEKLPLDLIGPRDDLLFDLRPELLGRSLNRAPLSAVSRLVFPYFVKPVQPKLFQASVYRTREALERATRGLAADTSLMLSEIVEFRAEARCFVLQGEVLDVALYSGRGLVAGAREFATLVAAERDLPDTYVLDVGLLDDSWAVVELNACWGAGLNGCDPVKALPAIAAASCWKR